MCTTGPNDNLWLTEASEMDMNGCDMLADSNFALFWDNGGYCGFAREQSEELESL